MIPCLEAQSPAHDLAESKNELKYIHTPTAVVGQLAPFVLVACVWKLQHVYISILCTYTLSVYVGVISLQAMS